MSVIDYRLIMILLQSISVKTMILIDLIVNTYYFIFQVMGQVKVKVKSEQTYFKKMSTPVKETILNTKLLPHN